MFEPRDVQEPLLEIDLVPPQRHQLADPQSVAVGEGDQGRISAAVPANSARRLDQLLDFLRRQMLPRAPFAVRNTPWRSNFPVFGCSP